MFILYFGTVNYYWKTVLPRDNSYVKYQMAPNGLKCSPKDKPDKVYLFHEMIFVVTLGLWEILALILG